MPSQPPTTMPEACTLIGATLEQTGGGCTALVVRLREDFEILITSALPLREATAPELLDEPVYRCCYENGEPVEDRTFPTLLEAVMDIYGPIAEVSA